MTRYNCARLCSQTKHSPVASEPLASPSQGANVQVGHCLALQGEPGLLLEKYLPRFSLFYDMSPTQAPKGLCGLPEVFILLDRPAVLALACFPALGLHPSLAWVTPGEFPLGSQHFCRRISSQSRWKTAGQKEWARACQRAQVHVCTLLTVREENRQRTHLYFPRRGQQQGQKTWRGDRTAVSTVPITFVLGIDGFQPQKENFTVPA